MRQMALLPILHDLVRARSQLIVATHSPILLAYPGAAILEFGAGGVERTAYEETEHFRITRDFLNRYPALLRTLLDDAEEPAGDPPRTGPPNEALKLSGMQGRPSPALGPVSPRHPRSLTARSLTLALDATGGL